MYNYTFIIPHKNCPDLLQRCVASIPERDDVQIIVVDDNSDEGKKPSLTREGVEVVLLDAEHSKGAGRARNVGLKYAKGKWLLFADADDYYTECLSSILDKYVDDDKTDIVYLNAEMFDEHNKSRPLKTNELIQNYNDGTELSEKHLRYSFWTPWSRMVKKNVVQENHLLFDEIPACNDKMFCLQCSFFARILSAESSIVYRYYRPSQGSQTDRKRNYQMIDGLLDVRCRTIALYRQASYKPIPSIAELLFNKKYSKNLTKSQILKKYTNNLSKAHVSMLMDLLRFVRKKTGILQK